MRKIKPTAQLKLALLFFSLFVFGISCQKGHEDPAVQQDEEMRTDGKSKDLKDFIQVNLVGNNDEYGAARVDPTLINAWGIAFSPTGTAWVNAQGGHVSEVYNREGLQQLAPVNIPSPGGQEGGNPTGIIFNPGAADFVIPAGNGGADASARFIFVGVDGVVSAWNPTWGNHSYRKFNNVATSAYTGLTLAARNGSNFLYAADFRGGKIVVWDKNWAPVSLPFADSHIPRGYSPFNIQNVGGMLYVTYAKVGADGRSEAGVGKGFVDIYNPDGILVERFAEKDKLNAPWGVAMAPASFFPGDMDDDDDDDKEHHDNNGNHAPKPAILIGNFGDGRINVYSTEGKLLGQLKKHNHTLEIEGLWAITFAPTTSTIDPNRLYFAAGPEEETDGLFGYIIKDSTDHPNSGHHGDD